MRKAEISECELTTMKCVWDAGEPVTCQYVLETLRDKYGMVYKDTTVYTFLKNLKTKGFIDSKKNGITYFYPIRDEIEFRDKQLKKAQTFWFGGSFVNHVTALCKLQKLTKEDKEEIQKMLDEM